MSYYIYLLLCKHVFRLRGWLRHAATSFEVSMKAHAAGGTLSSEAPCQATPTPSVQKARSTATLGQKALKSRDGSPQHWPVEMAFLNLPELPQPARNHGMVRAQNLFSAKTELSQGADQGTQHILSGRRGQLEGPRGSKWLRNAGEAQPNLQWNCAAASLNQL